jgi:prepilin-type N-terminal cleavage/methylation domain-containing protein
MAKNRGFSLIELLIVVAVVGLLTAIFVPNALLAIQKAKQRETMKDMVGIATAVADYITDAGEAPDAGNQSGPLLADSDFVKAISPSYIRKCPVRDQWGFSFRVYSGNAVGSTYSIPAEDIGADDFLIVSLGRDGLDGGTRTFTYLPDDLPSGLYEMRNMPDFNNDLINLNGTWLHAPRLSSRTD